MLRICYHKRHDNQLRRTEFCLPVRNRLYANQESTGGSDNKLLRNMGFKLIHSERDKLLRNMGFKLIHSERDKLLRNMGFKLIHSERDKLLRNIGFKLIHSENDFLSHRPQQVALNLLLFKGAIRVRFSLKFIKIQNI